MTKKRTREEEIKRLMELPLHKLIERSWNAEEGVYLLIKSGVDPKTDSSLRRKFWIRGRIREALYLKLKDWFDNNKKTDLTYASTLDEEKYDEAELTLSTGQDSRREK